jgi:hypothetical protein
MDVDLNPLGQGTPPGTPFEEEYIQSNTRGRQTAATPGNVSIENYYAPLTAEQTAQATADEAEAEAAEAAAAAFIANLAMNLEETEAAEAAAAKALAEAAALAEAEAATREEAAVMEADAAAVAAGVAAGSATRAAPLTAEQMAKAEAEAQETAAAQARKAEAALKAPITGEGADGAPGLQHTRDSDNPLDTEDWELSEEGLPEGSTLSGSKALMEEYPEDEANSKKTKKTNIGKGKKNKNKA